MNVSPWIVGYIFSFRENSASLDDRPQDQGVRAMRSSLSGRETVANQKKKGRDHGIYFHSCCPAPSRPAGPSWRPVSVGWHPRPLTVVPSGQPAVRPPSIGNTPPPWSYQVSSCPFTIAWSNRVDCSHFFPSQQLCSHVVAIRAGPRYSSDRHFYIILIGLKLRPLRSKIGTASEPAGRSPDCNQQDWGPTNKGSEGCWRIPGRFDDAA
jgi:hypothetical protein